MSSEGTGTGSPVGSPTTGGPGQIHGQPILIPVPRKSGQQPGHWWFDRYKMGLYGGSPPSSSVPANSNSPSGDRTNSKYYASSNDSTNTDYGSPSPDSPHQMASSFPKSAPVSKGRDNRRMSDFQLFLELDLWSGDHPTGCRRGSLKTMYDVDYFKTSMD